MFYHAGILVKFHCVIYVRTAFYYMTVIATSIENESTPSDQTELRHQSYIGPSTGCDWTQIFLFFTKTNLSFITIAFRRKKKKKTQTVLSNRFVNLIILLLTSLSLFCTLRM